MRQLLLPLALLFGLALAGPCAQRPYTLETEYGLLGGNDLTYDGETLVFEGAACLEKGEVYLEAPLLRYLESAQRLEGENLKGHALGWQVRAERLLGKTLIQVVLEKGRLRAEVQEALLPSENAPLEAKGVFLNLFPSPKDRTPAYRVRSERAEVKREEIRLKGLLATPCACGEEIALKAEEARFDPDTGEVQGDMALEAYGLEVGLGEARANLNRPPRLEAPFVLSGSETGGVSLGLEGFPIPRKGEEIGAWPLRLTLVAEGLASPLGALRVGLREGGRGFEARLGYAQGVKAFWDDLYAEANPNPIDSTTPRFTLRYTPSLHQNGLFLRPFLAYTETPAKAGWSLGAEGRFWMEENLGAFQLSLFPEALLALYPGKDPYLSLGGSLGLRYGEGLLWFGLSYAGRYEALRKGAEFAYETRGEFQRLSLEAGYGAFSFGYTLENPLGNRMDRLEGRFQDPEIGGFRLAYLKGSYPEMRLAYTPKEPGRDCREAFWVAPELGLYEGGFSRYSLEARYYDCCLAYTLRFSRVLKGQYGEAEGLALSFSLRLR